MIKRSLKFAAAISTILFMAACAPAAPGTGSGDGSATKLIVAPSSAMSPSWAAFAVAEKLGYFKQEDIQVELQFPGGSSDVMQAVATNSVQIGGPTPEAVLAAVDKGQSVKMFYNWSREAVQSLAVLEESNIHSFADLGGKTIGVAAISSGAKLIAEAALRDAGVDPAKVTFIATGAGVAAADALKKGAVDALMLWDTEYAMMTQSGMKLRTMMPERFAQLFSTGFTASDKFIESNPKALEGFGRAWSKATVWATENPEAAVKMTWELYPQTKTADTDEFLQQQVQIFKARNEKALAGDPIGSKHMGSFDEGSVGTWASFAAEYGITTKKLNSDDLYTNKFVEPFNDFDVDAVRKQTPPA